MATSTVTKTAAAKAAVKAEPVKEVPVKEAPVKRTYAASDMIPVRSITQGELLMPGKKSQILYRWSAYGDITEVEYQDLYSCKASRSDYIYKPLFIIMDEELLSDPRWKDVDTLYNTMHDTDDIRAVLELPPVKFEKVLKQIPKGFLDAIKVEAATQIEAGTFDSLNKIKILDAVCGTDFKCLID